MPFQIASSREVPGRAAGVPEQHRLVGRERAGADARDQAGHRLRRVRPDRARCLRAARRASWLRWTPASARRSRRRPAVVDVDRAIGADRRGLRAEPRRRRRRAGREWSARSDAGGSSALTPMTRADSPNSAQPAMSPACVPPDDVAWTMTSGRTRPTTISATPRAKPIAPVGVDAPSGTMNGGRPPARSSAAAASIAGARSSRGVDEPHLGAEQPIEPQLPVRRLAPCRRRSARAPRAGPSAAPAAAVTRA